MAYNDIAESSLLGKQDNTNEILKASSPDLEVQDTIDLYDIGTTYDKKVKVGITLPGSLIKKTDKMRGDVPRSTYIRRTVEYYLKQGKIR